MKAYLLGQDKEISQTNQSQASLSVSTKVTRKRKEEIFEDFLCDLFTKSLSDKLVQRVSGNFSTENADIVRSLFSRDALDADKDMAYNMISYSANQMTA